MKVVFVMLTISLFSGYTRWCKVFILSIETNPLFVLTIASLVKQMLLMGIGVGVGGIGWIVSVVTKIKEDDALTPEVLTVFNPTLYVVPFVKPEINTGLAVCAGLNGINVVPPFIEYS